MAKKQPLPVRVLVVEDDVLLAMGLELALCDEGADEVVIAKSASDALGMLSDISPQLMVLDVNLEDSDQGFGLAEIAFQIFNPPPFIIFSTGSPERIPKNLASRGQVFAKPYDPHDLARSGLAHV